VRSIPQTLGRRSLLPWLFPAGLGLVVVVNMVLLWFALETFPGTVTANSYERGRKYGQVLERDAAIEALGWRVDVRWQPEHGGAVVARYLDRDGQPVRGLMPRAVITRPLGDASRLDVLLREGESGVYSGNVALPHRGLWDVSVTAETRSVPHAITVRVNLR
jgi:nitrogen fixation protein FixH